MGSTQDREPPKRRQAAPTYSSASFEAHELAALSLHTLEIVPGRSRSSIGAAVSAHALLFGYLLWISSHPITPLMPSKPPSGIVSLNVPPPPHHTYIPSPTTSGGGGGAHGRLPVSAGHLPKPSPAPVVLASSPPKIPPKLPVEPAIDLETHVRMQSSLPNLGVPDGPSVKISSLGNGSGDGIGNGSGAGMNTGFNGNTGGDTYQIGGDVSAPRVIYKADAEFSEEARKQKFEGVVLVHLVVDTRGHPTQIRVLRGVGRGLDEKARDAVAQYKFLPAHKSGRAVPVELNVAVDFRIF